jgi:hypothetical protein
MSSMFDYDDSINLAFDAKIAGKSLVAAKHELLTKTGDFLFLAHSDRELAQRMQMVEEDIEKVAYRKLANISDSKAKLVRTIHEEWQIRHASCEMCNTKTAGFLGGFCHGCGQVLGAAAMGAMLASNNKDLNHHDIFCGKCKQDPSSIQCKACTSDHSEWEKQKPYKTPEKPYEKPNKPDYTDPHPHAPVKKPYEQPNKKKDDWDKNPNKPWQPNKDDWDKKFYNPNGNK